MSLRDRLVDLLEEGNPDPGFEWKDDTPLISSGLIDSLALFRLALWIEKETGSKLDLTTIAPLKEWDTIADILHFIETRPKYDSRRGT
jgi:acyl carrier protein